jgi:two-component system LytT family sensor kinase
MKRKYFIILALVVCSYGFPHKVTAQDTVARFLFKFMQTDERMMARQPSFYAPEAGRIDNVFDFIKSNSNPINNGQPWSPIILGVLLNPKLQNYGSSDVRSFTKEYMSYVISDSSEAEIVAMGITKNNVKDYKYRVIENDSAEIVPWSKIDLRQEHGAKAPYGFIGKFRAPGKLILVEVQNIKKYGIRDGIVLDWRVNYKPVLTQIMVNLPDNGTNRIYYFNLKYAKMNKGYATKFIDGSEIPLDFRFPVDSISSIRFFVGHHETIPYSIDIVYKGAKKDSITNLGYYKLENFYDIYAKSFAVPGKYEVIIYRVGNQPENQILRIPFEVLPPPPNPKKAFLKQLIPYTVAALAGVAFLFFIYRRQNNIKLRRAAQEKQVVGLKLRSIRAQLNPHFMFNALTSIQNLINKNNISGANYYLSKFAKLTRQVLDSSNDELISLEDELKVLDDYLQMEQLRFNFKYEIKVDELLNAANIDIPAMLLQPFVENAIKHGIAGLNEEGRINVAIFPEKKDLLLTVTDNGVGFTASEMASGYGIKLSEERVQLLNQIYKDQTVTLTIAAAQPGTTVTIRLSNWI